MVKRYVIKDEHNTYDCYGEDARRETERQIREARAEEARKAAQQTTTQGRK
jgi:hypothetical protein